MKNINNINYDTIADIIYTDACTEYRKSKKPVFEITDFQTFQAMARSNQSYLGTANLKDVANALNKITGASATYKNKGFINNPTADWDEEDESVLLILTETVG